MAGFVDHDSYLAAAPEPLRPLLARLRSLLAEELPDAQEVVAYNMPGFGIDGTLIAGYAAFSQQCGLYVSPAAMRANTAALAAAGLKAPKTGVTFSPRKPIPDDLVRALARAARHASGR